MSAVLFVRWYALLLCCDVSVLLLYRECVAAVFGVFAHVSGAYFFSRIWNVLLLYLKRVPMYLKSVSSVSGACCSCIWSVLLLYLERVAPVSGAYFFCIWSVLLLCLESGVCCSCIRLIVDLTVVKCVLDYWVLLFCNPNKTCKGIFDFVWMSLHCSMSWSRPPPSLALIISLLCVAALSVCCVIACGHHIVSKC